MGRKSKYSESYKREAVVKAEASGNVSQTARELGISNKSLHDWIKLYGQPLDVDNASEKELAARVRQHKRRQRCVVTVYQLKERTYKMTTLGIIALAVGLVTMGLFSGLMFSLIVLLQPKWNQQNATEYIVDIQPFLKAAKGHPMVALVLFVGLLSPILTLLTNDTVDTEVNVLILLGVIVFGVGALGVTLVLNLPTYSALMALDAQQPSDDWQNLRRRFYHLNLMRCLSSTSAFVLLIAAAAVQL